jgi:hypothetical protein
VGEFGGEGVGELAEAGDLGVGVGVFGGVFGGGEVAEDAADEEVVLAAEAVEDVGDVFGLETEAVHAGVELEVYGVGGEGAAAGLGEEGVEEGEAVNFGFEVVFEEEVDGLDFGVHDEDGEGDTGAAEFFAFVGEGDGEVVATLFLQGEGYLGGAGAVSVGFDDAGDAGVGVEVAAVVAVVVDEGVEVYFEGGLVGAGFEAAGDAFKVEVAGAFEEDGFALDAEGAGVGEAVFGGREALEAGDGGEVAGGGGYFGADGDEAVYAAVG